MSGESGKVRVQILREVEFARGTLQRLPADGHCVWQFGEVVEDRVYEVTGVSSVRVQLKYVW